MDASPKEPLGSSDPLHRMSEYAVKLDEVGGRPVGQRTIRLAPDVLRRIEFQGVGWERFHMQSWMVSDPLFDFPATMDRSPIPQQGHRPPKMPEQVVQERLDIQPCEIASAKLEKEGQSPSLGRHRQGTDRRDPVLFVEIVNDGRRSFEALAASACAVLWKKITDRYCVPTSGPCRFSWVGSW